MSDVTLSSDGTVAYYSRDGFPTVTITDSDGTLTCVVTEVEGLAAERVPNAAEIAAGISTLNPPTVSTQDGVDVLLDLAQRALSAAVASTRGALSGPEDIMLRYRVTVAVNAALDALGYEV